MTKDEYLAALGENAALFVRAARDGSLDAQVPSCPDWQLRTLAEHLGGHYRWVNANLGRSPEEGPQTRGEMNEPPQGEALVDWVEAGAALLAATLEGMDLDTRCWTFVGEPNARFWCRRTAHESAMHRWDAQHTVGDADPIETSLAADGIDEWLVLLNAIRGDKLKTPESRTVHLHCTDTAGEWLLSFDGDGMQVTGEHAKGDVAARGSASDLLLMLLGRKPSAAAAEVFGDASVLEGFLAQSSF